MDHPLLVEQGALLAIRQFDVADEIDLGRAQALSSQTAGRMKLSRSGSQYLELPNPPVALHLGTRALPLGGEEHTVELLARLFDHGAISIVVRIPLAPGSALRLLVPLCDELYDSAEVDRLALAEAQALCQTLQGALKHPHFWSGSESYHLVFVERFTTCPTAAELLSQAPLAELLLGERTRESSGENSGKTLSREEREDVTQHAFSYLEDDLAVVDWNCAFVYEPSGSRDIPDLLEIANAQLLELRYFDERLDKQLATLYDEIARKRRLGLSTLLRSDYAVLRRKVMVQMLEVAEFTERVENSLKVVGDFYLARVYRAALRRLRIPAWQESVDRKEALLGQIYDVLKSEVEQGRMIFLEATIVVLILLELILALGKIL